MEMTKEAIEYFKFHRKIFCDDHLKICPKDSIAYQATLKEKEFYDMAIKALEQEPVLDKIRAEIKALTSNRGFLSCSVDHIHEEIDAVFDKYEAEKELEDD